MGPEHHESIFYELIGKPKSLTEDDLGTLRDVLSRANFNMVRPHILGKAQLRVDIDLIESLRRFDKASGELVETTNRLTKYILWLTVLAVVVGVSNIVAAAWPYLVSWIKNGFRFS